MAVGQHESIAVRPDRIGRVEMKTMLPKGVGDRGQGHGCSGVTGLGGLYRIHGEGSDRVDGESIDLGNISGSACHRCGKPWIYDGHVQFSLVLTTGLDPTPAWEYSHPTLDAHITDPAFPGWQGHPDRFQPSEAVVCGLSERISPTKISEA